MENQTFTISVYSENNVGLLNRISGIFLKRHINILSLNVSESEIESVSRFIIVVNTTEKWVHNIVGQIEKQIEVIKAFYHVDVTARWGGSSKASAQYRPAVFHHPKVSAPALRPPCHSPAADLE